MLGTLSLHDTPSAGDMYTDGSLCHDNVTVCHQLMLSTLSLRDTPSAGDMYTVSQHCHCASPADAEYTVNKGHTFSRCHAHCRVTVTVCHQVMLSTLSPRDTSSAGDIMYTVSPQCHCASPADAKYIVIEGHTFSR